MENKYLEKLKNCFFISERLRKAIYSLDKIIESNGKDKLSYILFDVMIISYASCFVSSGKGRIKLNEKEIFKGYENNDEIKSLKEIHDEIMRIRNEYVAHNGNYSFFSVKTNKDIKENEIILSFLVEIYDENFYSPDLVNKLFKHVWICFIEMQENTLKKLNKNSEKKYSFKKE